MRKFMIYSSIVLSLMASYKVGSHVQETKAIKHDARITERVMAEVTVLDGDKDGFIEVTNVNNATDTIAIEDIKGIKLGDRVQVDFSHDAVISSKQIHGYEGIQLYANH